MWAHALGQFGRTFEGRAIGIDGDLRRWVMTPTRVTLSLLMIGVGSMERVPTGKGGFLAGISSPGHAPTDHVPPEGKRGALVWVPDAIWPYCPQLTVGY